MSYSAHYVNSYFSLRLVSHFSPKKVKCHIFGAGKAFLIIIVKILTSIIKDYPIMLNSDSSVNT